MNIELVEQYVKLVNDNVRLACQFAENHPYNNEIGASYSVGKNISK